jgi:hypothetical protein
VNPTWVVEVLSNNSFQIKKKTSSPAIDSYSVQKLNRFLPDQRVENSKVPWPRDFGVLQTE